MTLTFEFDNTIPLYRQLYNYIKNEIKDGKITGNSVEYRPRALYFLSRIVPFN